MTPRVDETRCIGCGLCVQLSPELFTVNQRQIAVVIGAAESSDSIERLEAAVDYCPVQAILIEIGWQRGQ
jgi:ferredoxin